jgi:hypothetical protein
VKSGDPLAGRFKPAGQDPPDRLGDVKCLCALDRLGDVKWLCALSLALALALAPALASSVDQPCGGEMHVVLMSL